MKSFISLITALFLVLALAGCSNTTTSGAYGSENSTQAPVDAEFSADGDDMFTKRDLTCDYSTDSAVRISLNGDSITSSSSLAKIDGSNVTLTADATYIISGTLDDGSVTVNASDKDKVHIVLDGAHITSATAAAIFVKKADKVFVTLAKGSENSLTNGGQFNATDEGVDSVIFSKQDITLNGKGSLTVTSPAGHGIVSKDDLVISSGTYSIVSASHGIDANDSIRICDATVNIKAGKDTVHAENSEDTSLGFVYIKSGTFDLNSEGDCISAGAFVQIEDGKFDLIAGGGSENGNKEHSDNYGGFGGGFGGMGGPMKPNGRSYNGTSSYSSESSDSTSMKGVKAESGVLINGGEFDINSADDAVHSDSSVIINGGKLTIATGDDGIYADTKLTVTAGEISITECYEGFEATDVEILGGNINIVAEDDGINSSGGTDSSGTEGGRDGMFGDPMGRPGGMGGPGGMSAGNGSIVISGGTIHINASGDGIDANGRLEISGGHTTIVGPTQGDTATLDYDTEGIITGGTFIGTGASGMAQSFSDSDQGVIALNVGNQPAGTIITIKGSDGNELIATVPELGFAVVIISTPELEKGKTYTVCIGDQTGDFQAK